MLSIIVYYLILPFAAAALVIRFVRKHGGSLTPEDISRHCRDHPIEKKFYRALRRAGPTLESLGDFEIHDDAVDAAFKASHEARGRGLPGSFLVLNHRAEILDQFDIKL